MLSVPQRRMLSHPARKLQSQDFHPGIDIPESLLLTTSPYCLHSTDVHSYLIGKDVKKKKSSWLLPRWSQGWSPSFLRLLRGAHRASLCITALHPSPHQRAPLLGGLWSGPGMPTGSSLSSRSRPGAQGRPGQLCMLWVPTQPCPPKPSSPPHWPKGS